MRNLLILAVVVLLALSISMTVSAKGHRSGQQLFDEICMGCHDTGMLDAPLPESEEFHELLDKKGLDKLVENARKGLNDMPAMGSCGDCSEKELRAAVKFLLGIK